MTDAAFLSAIADRPDDDAPRLVYADWLEERGDAERAEFIRLQCELAKLAEHDPTRLPLESRERELLEANEPRWLGSLPLCVDRWEFRRGLLDQITLEAGGNWFDYSLPAGVTRLTLFSRPTLGPADLDRFFLAKHPARLRELELALGLALTWNARTLLGSPLTGQLARLSCPGVPMDGVAWGPLLRDRNLANVTDLSLSGYRPNDLDWAAEPTHAPRWTGLDWPLRSFRHRALNDPPSRHLSACRHLRRLRLHQRTYFTPEHWLLLTDLELDWEVSGEELAQLAVADCVPNLRRLDLTFDRLRVREHLPPLFDILDRLRFPALRLRIAADSEPALRRLFRDERARRGLSRLEYHQAFRPALMRELLDGPEWRGLVSLYVNPGADAGADGWPGSVLGRLRSLRLFGQPMADAQFRHMLDAQPFPLLRELYFDNAYSSPAVIAALAGWPGLRRLNELSFNCFAVVAGVEPLAASPHLSPLTHLALVYWDGNAALTARLRERLGRRLEVVPEAG